MVLVPPFPRVLEVFLVGTMECWEFFKAYTRRKFQNLEFDVCLIMDQLEKSGLEDLLGPDKIHLSKQGAGFIKAMISKHLNK